MRRLTYLTGTRADFGVMRPTLERIAATDGLALDLIVTGQHLSDRFGRTEREIEQSGLPIALRIPVPIDEDSGRGMARCAADVTRSVADFLAADRRDALLLLGDRGEMLAAGLAGLFAGLPIIHLCGGERSGSVDDSIRHALSKLAHLHLVAAEDGEQRLLAMGEEPWRIHRVGPPGLVGLHDLASIPVETLAARYNFDPRRPYALMLFHPVVQEADLAGAQALSILDGLAGGDFQIICLLPNADHGNGLIRDRIQAAAQRHGVIAVDHMPRPDFVSALANAALLAGNSSSGIVEAASFGAPVVNLGERQHGRLRSANIFDAGFDAASIGGAIEAALRYDASALVNVYGDGHADERIVEVLRETDLAAPRMLNKSMTY